MDALRLLRVVGVAGMFACMANSTGLAQDGVITADATDDQAEERPSLIQRVGHAVFSPVVNWGGYNAGIFPHYGIDSREVALWPSPDVCVDDRRCEPRPWAPRGYGLPKHTSCYRMDYAPYNVKHHESDFGPAYWLRNRREPCQDNCGHCPNCLHDGVQP